MRNIFITIIMILISLGSFAQTEFAPLGAKWTYKDLDGWMSDGAERISTYECIGADTIDGKIIKAIRNTVHRQAIRSTSAGALTYQNRTQLAPSIDSIYESNDTVFIYNDIFEKYTPLFVFNVREGDTIRLPVLDLINASQSTAFDSTMTLIIDSIRMVNYGGVNMETFYTSSYDGGIDHANSSPGTIKTFLPRYNWAYTHSIWHDDQDSDPFNIPMFRSKGAYTRLFGGVGIGLRPRAEHNINAGTFDGYILTDTITCYEDGNIYFNLSNTDCDSFKVNDPLSLKPVNLSKHISIYPNPAKDMLHIELEEPAKGLNIKIVNLLGSIVKSSTPVLQRNNSIDISDLDNGIYLLIIENNRERYYHKFLKQ